MPDNATRSRPARWKGFLYLAWFNLALFCVLLVGMELTGQVAFYLLRGYPIAESDRYSPMYGNLFEPHPYLVGQPRSNATVTVNDKTATITSMHTRWTGAPADAAGRIRVALLGGSTTFGTRVDDAESWAALLQDSLGSDYAVYNFGVPGYSSAEAIVQMALIVPEIQPDIVVFYLGWNDIRNYHDPLLGPDYYSHGLLQYSALALPIHVGDNGFARMARVSAVFKLAARLSRSLWGGPEPEVTPLATPDTSVDRWYLRNLRTLRQLTAAAGARTMFVPQVLNVAHFRGRPTGRFWSPRIVDDAMPDLLARFNTLMNEACPPSEADCVVVDAVLAREWTPEDFVDDGHFGRLGGERFAGILAQQLRPAPR